MKTFVGIDLGSTTTKAVLMDEDEQVLGRGITNSRSNYDTACRVASQEAAIDARFALFRREFGTDQGEDDQIEVFLAALSGVLAREYPWSALAGYRVRTPDSGEWRLLENRFRSLDLGIDKRLLLYVLRYSRPLMAVLQRLKRKNRGISTRGR